MAMRYLTFCFLLLTSKPFAQELFFNQPLHFQNLPSLETYSIFQDSKGFLWISTDAGICRYDGNKLTTFTVKDGLPENVVFNIYEDQKERIWFNTLSGYFFYYYQGTFHSIHANDKLKKLCRSLPIVSFYIGESDTLYGALNGGSTGGLRGVLKIPPENDFGNIILDSLHQSDCSRYMQRSKLNFNDFIYGSGKLITPRNYYILSYNNHLIKNYIQEKDWFSGNGSRAELDPNGNVYIFCGPQLDIITKEGILKGSYYFDERINSCYVDYHNDLWVCTGNGGYFFKSADVSTVPTHFLKTIPLSSAILDREGTLWVASLEKGIFQALNTDIRFLNEDKEKPLYLQKDSNQLNITYKSGKITSLFCNDSLYTERKVLKGKGEHVILSFLDKNLLCVATGSSFSILLWQQENRQLLSLNGISIKEVLRTGQDSLLFIGPSHMVSFYNREAKTFLNPFPLGTVYQLKNKQILVGSRNNSGIYVFNNGNFTPYLPHLSQLKTRINAIIEDAKGNIWFATNEYGLYGYDFRKQLHHYTMNDGLISDKVNTLAMDDQNNLWIGSYNGLTQFSYKNDLKDIQILHFDKSHGLPNAHIEKLMAFNKKIVCMSKDVCFYFREDQLKKNTTPPLIYIESISINEKSYLTKDKPVLDYDQHNLRIQASLISFKNTERRNFLYKLSGYDTNWHTSTSGDIQYTNLPHGNYVFIIYGLNNDLIKSDHPAVFVFTIKRPFWLTWWFVVFEIICLATLFYFVFKLWKSRIQKREHHKAMINQKIAEFKMTALRSQMNPHFVFNAISSIQHYILKQDTFKSYNYLAKFSLLIRTILDNSKEEYIALSQEINTLKLYIDLEQIRFKNSFKFILNIDKNLEMDTYIPTMLIQPYVENSIWHGLMPKQTNCILEIGLEKKDTYILATIKDNGVGRDYPGKKSKLHESKGMSITEQRIKELQQTNEKKFQVTIIDLKDENGDAAGTEVQIIIPFDL